jgi:hypothetical protein
MNFFEKIIYNIKKWFYSWFGRPKLPSFDPSCAAIDGATLFHDEYNQDGHFVNLSYLYSGGESPLMRIPYPHDHSQWSKFNNTISKLLQYRFEPLVLFDCFYSDASMNDRIDNLKRNFSGIKYFQLFNELPHMPYPGQQMDGLDDLIKKTNDYTKILKLKFFGSKVVSMAPANILQRIDYTKKWGDNQTQLKRFIRESDVDIIGLHCYVTSKTHEFNFRYLIDDLKDWNKNGKDIWITETGVDRWDSHVKFYDEWISRFRQHIPCVKKVFWYRQTIANIDLPDGKFALEAQNPYQTSPLYKKLYAAH